MRPGIGPPSDMIIVEKPQDVNPLTSRMIHNNAQLAAIEPAQLLLSAELRVSETAVVHFALSV